MLTRRERSEINIRKILFRTLTLQSEEFKRDYFRLVEIKEKEYPQILQSLLLLHNTNLSIETILKNLSTRKYIFDFLKRNKSDFVFTIQERIDLLDNHLDENSTINLSTILRLLLLDTINKRIDIHN